MPADSKEQPAASADGQADVSAAASTGPAWRPSSAKPAAPFSRFADLGSTASHPGGLLAKLCRLTGHQATESGPQQTPEQTQEPAVQAMKLAQPGLAVDAAEPAAAGTGSDAPPASQADRAAADSAAVAALAPLCPAEAASPAGMPVSSSVAGGDASNGDNAGSETSRGMPSACNVRPTVSSTHASPPGALGSGLLGPVESRGGGQVGCETSAGQLQLAPPLEAATAAAAPAGSHRSQGCSSQGSGQLPQQALPSGGNTRAGTPAKQQASPGSLRPLAALDLVALETGPLPGPGGGAGDDPWGLAVELEDDGLAGKPWLVVRSIKRTHNACSQMDRHFEETPQASRHILHA